jgi:hypothetical protein
MTSISVTEFETHLQWQGEQRAALTSEQAPELPLGGMAGDHSVEDRWSPETLLVGAVEGRTLQAFLERARAERITILFYQSSAMGRRVEGGGGMPHFTDFIVRPHVAVCSEEEAEQARRIFEELPGRCFPSSMMQLTPRIEPVVEVWDEAYALERVRHSSLSTSPHPPAMVSLYGR